MAAAELASDRITEPEVKMMKECIYDMQEALQTNKMEQYFENNVKFHAALVSAAHNRFFDVNYASLQDLILFSQKENVPKGIVLEHHFQTHIGILEAIRSGNKEQARERVRNHLQTTINQLIKLSHHKGSENDQSP